ncbi:glutathione binding-like protein [Novosphingopyxis iocasae]|uniref:glutathione binding-like protein n=1 Tax=Novosphingopyxis iocasae TaxID=2762729 RepID=UPI0016516BA5|nr:glutathione binding-like protein [Novosphingopyxis iocasae]
MKLYYSPGACSLASHIAFVESGEDYQKEKVDLSEHKTESGKDFYEISPRGYVPAIETEDGLLTENPAVLTLLADRFGTAPEGRDRYKMLEWIGFIGTEIHGAYGPLFGGAEGSEKEAAKQTVEEKFKLAEKLMDGGDWLVGDKPTPADNYLFVTTLWAEKFGVNLPRTLQDYRARHKERPAVQQAMKEEGLG